MVELLLKRIWSKIVDRIKLAQNGEHGIQRSRSVKGKQFPDRTGVLA